MASTLGEAVLYLLTDNSKLESGLESAETKTESTIGGMAKFMGTALVAGAAAAGTAIAGIGIAGVKSFVGFQKQMNEVFTLLPGISQKGMGAMTEQVKAFAKQFGVLPEEVVPALYQSLSAGVPADNVFAFMETAQKAAAGGVTELKTAVDGISSVVNAYGSDIVSATEASDAMFTTVRLGKTNFEQLSASLFNVVPTAASLGVQFGEVTAALAAMTLQGVPTSVATTQLRQLFVELSQAGGKASTVFEEMSGKTFADFIAGGGGVADALDVMQKGADKAGLRLSDMFGSVEAGQAALALTGTGAKTFAADIAAMSDSAGATDTAFNTMQAGIGVTFNKLSALWSTTMLDIGGALAPLVEEQLPNLQTIAQTVSDKVVGFFQAIPPAVESVKKMWHDDFLGMRTDAEEFMKLGPDFDTFWHQLNYAFSAGGKSNEESWTDWLTNSTNWLASWIRITLSTVGTFFENWGNTQRAWMAIIGGDWSTGLGLIGQNFTNAFNGILNYVEYVFGPGLSNYMKKALQDAWDGLKDLWNDVSSWWTNSIGALIGTPIQVPAPVINPANTTTPNQQVVNDILLGSSGFSGQSSTQSNTSSLNNNIVVNMAGGGYDQGFAAGEGIVDAMRFRGH